MSQPVLFGQPVANEVQSYHEESLSRIETQAARMSAVAKKNWSDGCVAGSIFVMGVLFGSAGSGVGNEIAAKVEGIAVPKILQLAPILVAVAAVAIYAILVIPIIIYRERL